MSNAITIEYLNSHSLTCALGSDLFFGVDFALLAIASAMNPILLLSPASTPVVFVGLGLVIGGGILRIVAGETLSTVSGGLDE